MTLEPSHLERVGGVKGVMDKWIHSDQRQEAKKTRMSAMETFAYQGRGRFNPATAVCVCVCTTRNNVSHGALWTTTRQKDIACPTSLEWVGRDTFRAFMTQDIDWIIRHLPRKWRRLFAHRRLLQEPKNRHEDPVCAQHIPGIAAVSGDIAERPQGLLLKHGVRSRKEANKLRCRRKYRLDVPAPAARNVRDAPERRARVFIRCF